MDIDIDLPTSFKPTMFNAVKASIHGKEITQHPCGLYFYNIPIDPITKLSAIPHEYASLFGFNKIDLLHLSLLDDLKTRNEVKELINKEPNWELLLDENIVKQLFQLSNHYELLMKIKPTNIEELADVIALSKPAKMYLVDTYIKNKKIARELLYVKTDDKFYIKKSHAIAYAMNIVLQLNKEFL